MRARLPCGDSSSDHQVDRTHDARLTAPMLDSPGELGSGAAAAAQLWREGRVAAGKRATVL